MARVQLSSIPIGTIWGKQLDASVKLMVGVTAHVYGHGTTVHVPVYAGETGSTQLPQPVTADSNGQLPGWCDGPQKIDIVAVNGGVSTPPAEYDLLPAEADTRYDTAGAASSEAARATAAEAAAIATAEGASIPIAQKGAASGVPELDAGSKLLLSRFPAVPPTPTSKFVDQPLHGEQLTDLEAIFDSSPFHPAARADTWYRKSVITFTLDDARTQDTSVAALLTARGFPFGLAVISQFMDGATISGNAGLTTAQVKAFQDAGNEILAHTRNHVGDPGDVATLISEAMGAQADLRAKWLWADSAVQPGTWLSAFSLLTEAQLKLDWVRKLRGAFAAYFSYIPEAFGAAAGWQGSPQYDGFTHPLPMQARYGVHRSNFTDGAYTLVQQKACVDFCAQYGGLLAISGHSYRLDGSGFNTTADFTALLDYIKTYRDAGKIDILTPSGALFARKREIPTGILRDPNFLDSATGAFVGWVQANGVTVTAGAGLNVPGTNLAGGAASTSLAASSQLFQWFRANQLRTGKLVVWAKPATPGSSASARVNVRSYNDNSVTQYTTQDLTLTIPADVWTKIELPFSPDPRATIARCQLFVGAGSTSDAILWSNGDILKT